MAMNTQHLQYIIEIERTRSISQAAENLFIGQPNLSRILHDVEQMLGFRIFERSTRGVRPTTRGTIFLQHAKSILRETEAIEALGPKRAVANRLRVCIPRSAAMLDLTAQYLAGLPQAEPVDAVIRECHARTALETLASGETEIGVIRFRSEYRDYFEEQMTQRGLNFEILSKYRYQILLCRDHPLAQKSVLQRSDLADLPVVYVTPAGALISGSAGTSPHWLLATFSSRDVTSFTTAPFFVGRPFWLLRPSMPSF